MFDENCFFSRGAPASRQSGTRDPGPQWAGGLQPHARAAPSPTAPSGQGGPGRRAYIPCPRSAGDSGRASERRSCSRHPVGRGAPAAHQSGARPWPPDTFSESTYPEMQRKHIPRVNEYQS